MTRVPVVKTCKLLINGAFPRSESGRSIPLADARGRAIAAIAHASRKDLRDAVEAASAAQGSWAASSAYLRGQILYRLAEMVEARQDEFAHAIVTVDGASRAAARAEVSAAVDRLVVFAGWTDKLAMVLGNENPVAGPFHSQSRPEPCGVVAVVAPDRPSLLGLVSLLAPPLCAGNSIVALASDANPLPAVALMEAVATSDLPAGVVNILTGRRGELLPHVASHRGIRAVNACVASAAQARTLALGIAENLKRVRTCVASKVDWASEVCDGPAAIDPFVEIKAIWQTVGA